MSARKFEDSPKILYRADLHNAIDLVPNCITFPSYFYSIPRVITNVLSLSSQTHFTVAFPVFKKKKRRYVYCRSARRW